MFDLRYHMTIVVGIFLLSNYFWGSNIWVLFRPNAKFENRGSDKGFNNSRFPETNAAYRNSYRYLLRLPLVEELGKHR